MPRSEQAAAISGWDGGTPLLRARQGAPLLGGLENARGVSHREQTPPPTKHGLGLASMSGHASLPDGLSKIENHERIIGEQRHNIDLAAEYGIGGPICFSGNRSRVQSDLEGMATCAHPPAGWLPGWSPARRRA